MQPRVDFSWAAPVQLREQHWGWRHGITGQVVNPDIDGLLTACLLHHVKGWRVIGFYDTVRLLLDQSVEVPLDLHTTAFVDVDMCWPGARSISQHVVRDRPEDLSRVQAYGNTINPSVLLGDHSRSVDYRGKYPFGTFQWVWWLIGARAMGSGPDPSDRLLTGLAWMPDGGFLSVRDQWRANCLAWATEKMPGSVLEPLAQSAPERALELAAKAAATLRDRSGVQDGWRNHQFTLTTGSAAGPQPTMSNAEGLVAMQALCDVICDIYGWKRLRLPSQVVTYRGDYRVTSQPPPGWPEAANRGDVVSLAVTRASQFCWTAPGDLPAALGEISEKGGVVSG